MRQRFLLACCVLSAAMLFPHRVSASGLVEDTLSSGRAAAPAPDPRAGAVFGVVLDAETRQPLPSTYVRRGYLSAHHGGR
jgi:hypothetical protein